MYICTCLHVVEVNVGFVSALVSGEVTIRFLETAVGIEGKSNQGLEVRRCERLRVVSELAVETGLGWTGGLMLSFHERGDQQLCSSLLVGV